MHVITFALCDYYLKCHQPNGNLYLLLFRYIFIQTYTATVYCDTIHEKYQVNIMLWGLISNRLWKHLLHQYESVSRINHINTLGESLLVCFVHSSCEQLKRESNCWNYYAIHFI